MKVTAEASYQGWGAVRMLQDAAADDGRTANNMQGTPFVQLQRRLVQDKLRAIEDVREALEVRSAADEASAISWTTGFPFLTYPVLFEEQSSRAIERAKRQEEIHERSRELLGLSE